MMSCAVTDGSKKPLIIQIVGPYSPDFALASYLNGGPVPDTICFYINIVE